jgi:hypothetical protein
MPPETLPAAPPTPPPLERDRILLAAAWRIPGVPRVPRIDYWERIAE